MHITNLKIRNYRSIESMNINFNKLNILCGPNSVGKSNIMHAIQLPFIDIPLDKRFVGKYVRENIIKSKLNNSASIRIDVSFANAPRTLYRLAKTSKSKSLNYTLTLTKGGNLTRKLGETELNTDDLFNQLIKHFSVVYVPTIRDLDNDGLKPFTDLFKRSIQSNHGGREMKSHLNGIKATLAKKAMIILSDQKELVKSILNVKAIELSTSQINLDEIYNNMSLQINDNTNSKLPMKNIGTGHQSAVIINLYKQFGESLPGKTLYLFEEPDAHLHPPTIRSIGNQLSTLSDNSQALITTHSPILISHIGLDKVIHLKYSPSKGTEIFYSNTNKIPQTQINIKLLKYGLRLTESLFTKAVVLVEGASDAIVIGRMIQLKTKLSHDLLDILITPAGGKENIIELAEILQFLNISFITIFDYDAAYTTSSIPITNGNLEHDIISDIDKISSELNIKFKRGKKANTQLQLIKQEILNGCPSLEYYNNSSLQKIMNSVYKISNKDEKNLITSLSKNTVTITRKILSKYKVWLTNPDLENTIIGINDKNLTFIDPVLRKYNLLTTSSTHPSYRNAVKSILHSLSNKPEVLTSVIDSVYNQGGFSRTNLNYSINQIIETAS